MIQHMVAMSIMSGIDGARIQGIGVPEWNIAHEVPDSAKPDLVLDGQTVELEASRAILARPAGGLIELRK